MRKTLTVLLFVIALATQAFAANTKPPFIVIDYTYQDARDFHEGLAAVKSNDRWGYIDYLGRIAIPQSPRSRRLLGRIRLRRRSLHRYNW